jgi:integrase
MAAIKLSEKTLAALAAPATGRDYYWDTELAGFGVVVGQRTRTFVVRRWVGGRKVKVTIGVAGRVREDGFPWTVQLARRRAQELLGVMASGVDPNAGERAQQGGPTLRDGITLHVANMRRRGLSKRSIHAIETEVPRLMSDWIDRPIVELRGADMVAIFDRVIKQAKPRAGTTNPTGAGLANRLVRQVSAVWNALDRVHELSGRNPSRAVTKQEMAPRTSRIDDAAFPEWHAKVLTLSPVRRDLQLFVLFTGVRSDGARHVRWEHIDEKARTLFVARAKGDKPYTIPLSETCMGLLATRRSENAVAFAAHGGDAGWVFPSLTRARPQRVIAVAESKEARLDKETGRKVRVLPPLHDLRRTYNSVALEIGIPRESRNMLMNHDRHGVNVRHYGFPQNWDHLAECQAQIEAALWQRIGRDARQRRARGRRSWAASQASTAVRS